MKLPRGVTGDQLVRHLVKRWMYHIDGQQGSHIILVTDSPIRHRLPVPKHKPMATGTFRAICGQVCQTKGISLAELLEDL